uniref:NF-Y protein n=1 Tax=Tanacetum cinerariifolium TaxID=118510 RepID=A0A6L2MH62_TANCI|nr:NF-Y protein [Tanacetum cinerariifolium]
MADAMDGVAAIQPPTPPPQTKPVPGTDSGGSLLAKDAELKNEDYLGLSLSEIYRMAIDTHNLTQINSRLDEEDEDYDEE